MHLKQREINISYSHRRIFRCTFVVCHIGLDVAQGVVEAERPRVDVGRDGVFLIVLRQIERRATGSARLGAHCGGDIEVA